MARRRRKMRISSIRTGIQHSDTRIGNTGAATIESFDFVETQAGGRTVSGATQTTTANRDTAQICNIGDVIKFVNLFIEAGPRLTDVDDHTGWLEYAVVMVKDTETTVPTTQLGLFTLGDVCTKMFRNECIWTGAFPVGDKQPNNVSIPLKVPEFKQKLRIGDQWRLIMHFRSVDAGSVATAAVRFVASTIYKAYQ